ncbi:LuxR C-terminal-related transcriptional regulator [Amycolatopsis sp. GM8]|uniref:ATP-binding protein n=1 Tax=Amycolatopsis sp. GM8 TaxID=2896530 RepID=UPI001F00096B|nr:LuxR C-terminal-related transcriptional regulator [Amycolatopsis sp. GM8]
MAAPTSSRRLSGNLPAEVTTFVGRRAERADVKRALTDSRLLTLTGFGGVGKTRLALRAAEELCRAFPEGVWFVELATLDDAALVPEVVAGTLGLSTHGRDSALQGLADHLRNRTALLVLDNCEHLLDACALLVDTVLRACPHVRVLATSREPIGIRGETVLPIAPLAVPSTGTSAEHADTHDAIRLFADRARAACPGFAVTEENRAAVVSICRQLDGIPLALELAAVRLRGLAIEDLLAGLSDHLRLLSTGSRNSPERQRTLRGCIEWSYELCTPEERRLWAVASVFQGGFDTDALGAVCPDDQVPPERLLETLLSLVEKSVVTSEDHHGRTRYRMIEVIRRFGEDQLRESGLQDLVQRRHRDHYAAFAAEAAGSWFSSRQRELVQRRGLEHPNLRRALEFCLATPGEAEPGLDIATDLREHWIAQRALAEGARWIERLLSAGPVSAGRHVRALATAAALAIVGGNPSQAKPLIAMGTRLARDQDERTRALMTHVLGMYHLFVGELPQAIAGGEQALEVFRAAGDHQHEIMSLIILQMSYGATGDTERALAAYDETLRLCGETGDVWFRSYALWTAGTLHWQQGQTARGIELLLESLALKRATGDGHGLAVCLEMLACATAERAPRQAAEMLGVADTFRAEMGGPIVRASWVEPTHDDAVARLRAALGDEAFERAVERGRALDPEEGLDLALAWKKDRPGPRRAAAPGTLTRREQEVAELVTHGLTNKEIASKLVISQRTAETHVEHILTKLGFTSRAQIASWLAGQGTGT